MNEELQRRMDDLQREREQQLQRELQAWEARRDPKAFKKWQEHCQARASRFRGYRKKVDTMPPDAETFVRRGGMRAIEYAVGAKAAEEAIRFEREHWLPTLERWLPFNDEQIRGLLEPEIKRLRRCLGIHKAPLTIEERRAQVRERVRKHRQRKRDF